MRRRDGCRLWSVEITRRRSELIDIGQGRLWWVMSGPGWAGLGGDQRWSCVVRQCVLVGNVVGVAEMMGVSAALRFCGRAFGCSRVLTGR